MWYDNHIMSPDPTTDLRNLLVERIKKAYLSSESAEDAKVAIDSVICSAEFDQMPGRVKKDVVWYLAGFEDAWFHCKNWNPQEKQWKLGINGGGS